VVILCIETDAKLKLFAYCLLYSGSWLKCPQFGTEEDVFFFKILARKFCI
jgi:hypothetical protein